MGINQLSSQLSDIYGVKGVQYTMNVVRGSRTEIQ